VWPQHSVHHDQQPLQLLHLSHTIGSCSMGAALVHAAAVHSCIISMPCAAGGPPAGAMSASGGAYCTRRCVRAWRVMQTGWLPLGWTPLVVCRAAQQPRTGVWGCSGCPDTTSGPAAPTVALWGSSDACSCHGRQSGNGRRAGSSSSSSSMRCHGHTGTHCLMHHALWWLAPAPAVTHTLQTANMGCAW
jgi:hypothetical protein